MYFDICFVVSRIEFFLGGVTIDCSCTPDLHETPFEFIMSSFCIFEEK